ncbi:MAG: hypothetical protein K9J17_12295 [Flavobacteriales bacterium]|nr:hypothetical protein [Flavobacteriales bacterium]
MKNILNFLFCAALCNHALAQCIQSAYSFLDVNNVIAPADSDGSMGFLQNPGMNYSVDTGNGNTLATMAAAILIAGEVVGTDEIGFRQYAAGKALLIEYYYNYDEVGPAHDVLED